MGRDNGKRLSLLEEVASLYYEERRTQSEIADQLFISRSQISRLLQEAQEQGIVEIRVNHAVERNYDTENRLKIRYNLKDARIVNCRKKHENNPKQRAAKLAAQYLGGRIKRDTMLGVSWGSTVYETVRFLEVEKPVPINIVQIMGAAADANPAGSTVEMTQKLADLYRANVFYLNAPLFIEDEYVHSTIMADPYIAKTLEMAINSDIILTGIGTLDAIQSTNAWLGYMSDEMLAEITALGGIGCICARFFDREGRPLSCKWNDNCTGIRLENLKRVPEVVAVATGAEKADAIKGALEGGYIDVLISDSDTTHSMLMQ